MNDEILTTETQPAEVCFWKIQFSVSRNLFQVQNAVKMIIDRMKYSHTKMFAIECIPIGSRTLHLVIFKNCRKLTKSSKIIKLDFLPFERCIRTTSALSLFNFIRFFFQKLKTMTDLDIPGVFPATNARLCFRSLDQCSAKIGFLKKSIIQISIDRFSTIFFQKWKNKSNFPSLLRISKTSEN